MRDSAAMEGAAAAAAHDADDDDDADGDGDADEEEELEAEGGGGDEKPCDSVTTQSTNLAHTWNDSLANMEDSFHGTCTHSGFKNTSFLVILMWPLGGQGSRASRTLLMAWQPVDGIDGIPAVSTWGVVAMKSYHIMGMVYGDDLGMVCAKKWAFWLLTRKK